MAGKKVVDKAVEMSPEEIRSKYRLNFTPTVEQIRRLTPKKNSYEIPNLGRVRVCTACGLLLHADRFQICKRRGCLRSHCRPCQAADLRETYRKHAPERRQRERDKRSQNPERARALGYERNLRRHYGLTPADVESILQSQGGCCAICRTTSPAGPGKRFQVDHDHATGKIRGMLCSKCNTAIGLLADSPERATTLIAYLNESRKGAV